MSKSGKIALGGLLTALGVVLMFLTGLIPIGTYALPAIAGVLLIVAVFATVMSAIYTLPFKYPAAAKR